MTNVKDKSKEVIEDAEIDKELSASENLSEFYRLRARATIALLETGKRRSEIVSLEKTDLKTDDTFLYVSFTVRKKRKKNIRILQRTKKYSITSRWSVMILEYLAYLNKTYPNCKYLYPSGHNAFGSFLIDYSKHAVGQEIWRILKTLNSHDWPHQHRERRAVRVIRTAERKRGVADLNTVYEVRDVLDLERETTAYAYIRRFQTQRVEDQEEAIT